MMPVSVSSYTFGIIENEQGKCIRLSGKTTAWRAERDNRSAISLVSQLEAIKSLIRMENQNESI